MFSKLLEFSKNNFKTRFYRMTREKWYEVLMSVLKTFSEIYTLHGSFDASRCRMSHRRWRVRKLDLTGLSRDL